MEIPLHRSTRASTPPARSGPALWNLGFRPFYLLASSFAAISVLLWVTQFSGWLPRAYLAGPIWHGHEMLFGFATAVIAGFLLTAVPTWTQQPPLRGAPLMALALLWLAARVLVLTPFGVAATVVNALFPLAVATAIAVPLLRTRNLRNVVFIGLLTLLGILALTVHLAMAGVLQLPALMGLRLGLDVVLVVMVIIAGRVVPMFTNNGVPGTHAIRHPLLEKLALATIVLVFAADLLQWDPLLVAAVMWLAALVHGTRLFLWQPWRTWKTPLVWILHAAYAWIVVHLMLRGLSAAGWVTPSAATHALTVGAIGGLTIGMMARTARGHTGMPLEAGRAELSMFILIQLAALARVCGGVLASDHYLASVQASGLLWGVAFAVYAIRYWPLLTRPRVDGRPG